MIENEKAGRLPQQFGKFGECLVMWWLGHRYNYNVALVDHEGADIIAHNYDSSERLAISVKSGHRASFEFDIHNQNQLTKFAEKFGGLTPAVAFVFADNERTENAMIDVFLLMLDDIRHFCDTNEKGFSRPAKIPTSCQVSNGARFRTLQALVDKYPDRPIKHIRLQQTAEWIDSLNKRKNR